jgi:hypothetical protein
LFLALLDNSEWQIMASSRSYSLMEDVLDVKACKNSFYSGSATFEQKTSFE